MFGIKSLEDLRTYNFYKMRPTPEEGVGSFNRWFMQLFYFMTYMDMENEKSFVSDRTVIDVLAYSVAYGSLPDDDFDATINDSIEKYDLLFYCPRYAFVSDDDPKRVVFKEENKKVDEFLEKVCIENPHIISLHQASFEDRIKYIREVIDAYVRKSGADNLCQSPS
jgi:predicted ATPase